MLIKFVLKEKFKIILVSSFLDKKFSENLFTLSNENLQFDNQNDNDYKIKMSKANSLTTINPMADLMYKKHTRNQLINIIEEFDDENKTLKRQLNSKIFCFKI